jgi:tetratricopeptide (TPR) repeat protein
MNKDAFSQTDSFKMYRKEFNECEENIRKGKFEKAISCYQDLTISFPKNTKSYVRLAELFYKKHDKQNTLKYANKAIDINPNEAYAPLTYLANKMNSNQDADLALLIMNRLSVSSLDSTKQIKADNSRERLSMKTFSDKTPVPGVELINLETNINTAENEYLPSLSLDGIH